MPFFYWWSSVKAQISTLPCWLTKVSPKGPQKCGASEWSLD